MFIITTYKGVRKRLAIPDDVVMAGGADKYCTAPPADAWDAAEVVGPDWPFDAPAPVVASAQASVRRAPAPIPTPIAPVVDDDAPLSDED